ncbi:hypothetical protein ABFP36_23730, partial [Salmonella enterica subsp. enterica serovar Kentucky]|uniref:hypothetical protein n=1 Tax=Salmonella enterica TaxID=28901 RepID=UPI003F4B2AF9
VSDLLNVTVETVEIHNRNKFIQFASAFCIIQEFFNSTLSQEHRQKPDIADPSVFARIDCGWGSCDEGDRTRERSATGSESLIDTGHLMSRHKNRMKRVEFV